MRDNEDKKRIKALAELTEEFMKVYNMTKEEAVNYIFKNKEDKEAVLQRLIDNDTINLSMRDLISERETIYWTIKNYTTKAAGVSFKEKGFHKKKKEIKEFFDKLGFINSDEKELFYDNDENLEFILLPLIKDDLGNNLHTNYNKLYDYVKRFTKDKGQICEFSFWKEVSDHLCSIKRPNVLNKPKGWAEKVIRNKIMDYYYKQAIRDCEGEVICKFAHIVDHKIDQKKNEEDINKHEHGLALINFLMEKDQKCSEQVKDMLDLFFYEQDILMEQVLVIWERVWNESLKNGNFDGSKFKENIEKLYK